MTLLISSTNALNTGCRWCIAMAGGLLLATTVVLAEDDSSTITAEDLIGVAVTEPGPYYQDIQDAIEKFTAGNLKETQDLLEKAKKTAPRLAPPEIMLAQLYLAGGLSPQARGEMEKAIQKSPGDPEAYVMLGENALTERRFTDAGFEFEKALAVLSAFKENPKRSAALEIRAQSGAARADEGREQWKSAREHLEALAKLDPKNVNVPLRLGQVLLKLNDGQAAYSQFKQANKIDAKIAFSPEVAMARAYERAKDKTNAEKFFTAADKSGAQDASTQLALADWYYGENKFDEAAKSADRSIKLDPKNSDALLLRGIIARHQGDTKTAIKYLERSHILAPSNLMPINHLACALADDADEDNRKRALAFADLSLRTSRNNSEGLAALGWANYRLGRTKDAERILQNATAGGSVSLDAGYFTANVLKDAGQTKKAITVLENILKNKSPFVYRNKAQDLYVQLKQSNAPLIPMGSKTP